MMFNLIFDLQDGSSLPVKQFQYTGWPEEGVPDAGTGLIDLVGQVQKWQRNSGTHPIVVHCSGGSGRTGTFIAISILLERLKTEGVVDVFHTGRTLRLQRPGLIQTVVRFLQTLILVYHITYSHSFILYTFLTVTCKSVIITYLYLSIGSIRVLLQDCSGVPRFL